MAIGAKTMTTGRRTPFTEGTRSGTRHRDTRFLLSCLILATWLPFARAACGVEFLYPQPGLTFYYLDSINVTYTSNFSNPTLFAWCGQSSSPVQKFETSAPKYNGSIVVLLAFSSSDPCWFDLRPNTPACGDNSPSFSLLPVQRAQSDSKTTLGLASPTSASSALPQAVRDGELSSGAKAGIVIAAVVASLILVAMASCFFWRRRKRLQEAIVAGHIVEHDRRDGKGQEKTPLTGGSAHSNGSKEPLRVQQPYDGLPGSAGYDNALHSRGSSAYLNSPQSPGSPSGGFFPPPSRNKSPDRPPFMTDRETLEAARLHSTSVSSGVVSYGPNPVTPSITPRPSTRFHDNPSSSSDEYHPPSTSTHSISPQPQASQYPAKQLPPLVVSYGPNRITPTPVIASVAPEESVMKGPPDLPSFPIMGFPSHPFPSHEPTPTPTPLSRSDTIQATPADMIRRHDLSDEPPSAIAPLPPYASSDDFYAMEKGAIRKLQEPAAQAELPPTKDGYYHFGDHGTEYELQGAAPQREQQHPHQSYRNRNQTAALAISGGGRAREVDEQKFLLDDDEMRFLTEQKKRIRAEQQQQQQLQQLQQQGRTESYEMQQPGHGRSRGDESGQSHG